MGKSCLKQFYETSPKKKHRNCYIKMQNSALASMIKKKKHILRKKSTKKYFSTTKKHYHKKSSTKKHFCFLKTLAGRTAYTALPNSVSDFFFWIQYLLIYRDQMKWNYLNGVLIWMVIKLNNILL